MSKTRRLLWGLVAAQVTLVSAGIGFPLAAVLHAGPAAVALTAFSVGSVALACYFEGKVRRGTALSLLLPLLGLLGSVLPLLALFMAPPGWILVGLVGYALLGLETLVYGLGRHYLEKAQDETSAEE